MCEPRSTSHRAGISLDARSTRRLSGTWIVTPQHEKELALPKSRTEDIHLHDDDHNERTTDLNNDADDGLVVVPPSQNFCCRISHGLQTLFLCCISNPARRFLLFIFRFPNAFFLFLLIFLLSQALGIPPSFHSLWDFFIYAKQNGGSKIIVFHFPGDLLSTLTHIEKPS